MSKLIERLERTTTQSPQPMGFGPASRRGDTAPSLAVVGRASASELAANPDLAKAGVDAVLVVLDADAGGAQSALEGVVWGVGVGAGVGVGVGVEQVAAAKEAGCDFVALDADGAPASLLADEDLGKLIAVSGDLDEHAAGAIRGLDFDGALYALDGDLSPLSLARLIDVQRAHRLLGDPFLLAAPSELAQDDLRALRDAGVAGIVAPLADADAIARMRQSISELPPKRQRRKGRRDVMPLVPSSRASQQGEEDYDEGH